MLFLELWICSLSPLVLVICCVTMETIWKNTEGFVNGRIIIRLDLKEIGVDLMNWIMSTQDGNYFRVLVNELVNIPISSQL